MKKAVLLVKYYCKKAFKNFFYSFLIYALFSISIVLMFSIIVPSLGNKLPFFNNWHKIYTINGQVIADSSSIKNIIYIEIGSYKTSVNKDQSFQLKFPSKQTDSIPIIVSFSKNQYKIYRYSLKDIESNILIEINDK